MSNENYKIGWKITGSDKYIITILNNGTRNFRYLMRNMRESRRLGNEGSN